MELTPSQFLVARSLAKMHGHTWGDIADETYDLEAITNWSRKTDCERYPGISCPTLVNENVFHTSKGGRVSWEVYPNGYAKFFISRPNLLSSHYNTFAQLVRAIKNKESAEPAIKVLTVEISNCKASEQTYGFGTLRIGTSVTKNQPDSGFLYFVVTKFDLFDDLFFTRHVDALLPCLAALLLLDPVVYPSFSLSLSKEEYQRRRMLFLSERERQARQQAKKFLLPLYQRALPDPFDGNGEKPQTYWMKPNKEFLFAPFFIFHKESCFPVESEKTAVHATLFLRKYPNETLEYAVRNAISSDSYDLPEEAAPITLFSFRKE